MIATDQGPDEYHHLRGAALPPRGLGLPGQEAGVRGLSAALSAWWVDKLWDRKTKECPKNHFNAYQCIFSSSNIILISGSMMSSKFQEAFRDENAAKKGEVDGENDVKSGKKLQ